MGYSTSIRSKRQRIVTALDIGTSKICCLIAKASPTPDWFEGNGDAMQFEVLGFEHIRAEGLKAGMIAHLDSAEACIRRCRFSQRNRNLGLIDFERLASKA